MPQENLSVQEWDPKLDYMFDENMETLKLKKVPRNNPGRFSCIAANTMGILTAYVDVLLQLTELES